MSTTWFITGASRGLGREIVTAALERGDRVAATVRSAGALSDLEQSYGERLLVLRADVTDRDAVAAAVQAAHETLGSLDVVVNNAGYANLSAIEETTPDDFRAQIDTNFFGVVNTTQAVLPILREQGHGHIVNVSSVGARIGTPGLGAYQAAKWAVSGFTEVLAAEVRPLGITVTAIEPGGMSTDWAGSSMNIPSVGDAYSATVGMIAGLFQAGFTPLGDPKKTARAVLDLVALPEPPVRILFGSDAIASAQQAEQARLESDAAWREFTRSTDRDDASPEERDPLGSAAGDPETVVRRFIDEVVNGGDLAAIDELWADDLSWHGGSMGDIHGLAAYRDYMAANAGGAFAEMHLSIEEVVTSGSKVVLRFTNSGTQVGPFMGAAPSNLHAEWLGIGIYTVVDGKITEGWFGEDVLGMLLQLKVVTL